MDILNKAKANVKIVDDKGKNLFEESNLFVATGRQFIRDAMIAVVGITPIVPTNIVCELGSDATVPASSQIDIITPIGVVFTPPIVSSVSQTEIDFVYTYTNATGLPILFREMGLFYRTGAIVRPANPADLLGTVGYMLARLKTTYSAITIGVNRNITLTWKIVF